MQFCKYLVLAVALGLASQVALAADPEDDSPSGEPDVTIREGKQNRIEEYRTNGYLYAIRVVPKHGKPYFLVRADGDNNFVRADAPKRLIPSWKIFTW